MLATDDADELWLRCIGSIAVVRVRSPCNYIAGIGNSCMFICPYVPYVYLCMCV